MPIILGAGDSSSGYDVEGGFRFNDGDNQKLAQTFGSAGNRRTWTWSAWIKRGVLGTRQTIFSQSATTDNVQWVEVRFESNDKIAVSRYSAGIFTTNQVFRDPNAWFHIVVAFDTTQSTDTNRVKLYINGSQVTDVSAGTYPPQDSLTGMNQNSAHHIGDLAHDGDFNADFQICEVFSIDGTQHLPTAFGEFNVNGVWVPIDAKDDLTFGTNGYYLQFQQTGTSANASGMGADTSGNDRHFTPTNHTAADVITDTCTNNFMTWNTLYTNSRGTFAAGNLQVTTNVQGSEPYGQVEFGNFHVNSGKWYWEVEVAQVGSGGSLGLGMSERAFSGTYINGHNNGGSSGNVRYNNASGAIVMGSSGSLGTGATYTDGDTIMFAMDLDNSKFSTGKNGTWNNSQDPANGTNAFTLTATAYGDYWTPWISKDDTTNNAKVYLNTGNPVIANDSGNADENGYGDFEYAVPSGFYALCTKNLAEYG